MKIEGVAGKGHPTLRKGDVIPLSNDRKLCASAEEQIVNNSPEGYKRIIIPSETKVIGKVQHVPGRNTSKTKEADQYMGTVEVRFRTLRMRDDRVLPAKSVRVKIHCRDCTDDIGMPDLQAIDYKETLV